MTSTKELDIHDLCGLLDKRGLVLLGFAGGMLAERVEFCKDVRPKYLYIEDWDPHAAPAAIDRGFTLALHPHVFKPIHRLSDAIEILDAHPELKFLPDTAHLKIAGDDPAEAIRQVDKDRLTGVHLKDWTPEFGRSSHRYAQGFTELGEGIVELEGVLEELERINFKGWLIVEQDATRTDPQTSTLKSAEWLHEKGILPRKPEALGKPIARSRGPRPDRRRCKPEHEVRFVRSLLRASGEPLEKCYGQVVNAFSELMPCHLVTLWACNPANDFLSLLAMTPEIPLSGYVYPYSKALSAIAIERQTVTEFDDLKAPQEYPGREYRPKDLIGRLGLATMVSVPIINPANHNHMPFLLNLFPKKKELPLSRDELFWFGMDVGRAVDVSIDELCSFAAGHASLLAGQSDRMANLLLKFRKSVQNLLGCEEVAVFLVDDTGEKLQLAETSGTTWRVPEAEQYYSKGEGLTGRVWERNEPLLTTDAVNHPYRKGKSVEDVHTYHDSCMIAPLVDSAGDVVGVVRCQNKRTELFEAFNMFSEDDVAVLDAISQAVVPHLQVRLVEERHRRAVRRVTHELKTPIVAIRGATQLMQAAFEQKKGTAADFFGYDYLGDVWSWTEITHRLLGNADFFRFAEEGLQLQTGMTLLLKDVIAPAVRQVAPLLRERNFPKDKIRYSGFKRVPPLRVDKNLFQQVTFNLLSNAIKYAYKDRSAFQVEILGEEAGGKYVVRFRDWGTGIEESLKDYIFGEGFRAPEAIQTNVSGQGLGLWVVRQVVEAHGGTVEVTSCKYPTEIAVYLPTFLQLYRPAPSRRRPRRSTK